MKSRKRDEILHKLIQQGAGPLDDSEAALSEDERTALRALELEQMLEGRLREQRFQAPPWFSAKVMSKVLNENTSLQARIAKWLMAHRLVVSSLATACVALVVLRISVGVDHKMYSVNKISAERPDMVPISKVAALAVEEHEKDAAASALQLGEVRSEKEETGESSAIKAKEALKGGLGGFAQKPEMPAEQQGRLVERDMAKAARRAASVEPKFREQELSAPALSAEVATVQVESVVTGRDGEYEILLTFKSANQPLSADKVSFNFVPAAGFEVLSSRRRDEPRGSMRIVVRRHRAVSDNLEARAGAGVALVPATEQTLGELVLNPGSSNERRMPIPAPKSQESPG